MIHYHGGPVTPVSAAIRLWRGRHALISFAWPSQIAIAAEVAQTFILDNGAFTAWQQGTPITEWEPYFAWVEEWCKHPGFDWALIPDVIDGNETQNNALIQEFEVRFGIRCKSLGVPVWHLHESLDRLQALIREWPRVAFGSSAQFAEIGTSSWWGRMSEAMEIACDTSGRPRTKIHLLRGLDPTILSHIPASSGDSANVALNIGIDKRWKGSYAPITPDVRALVLADRIEGHATATRWTGSSGIQKNLELIG